MEDQDEQQLYCNHRHMLKYVNLMEHPENVHARYEKKKCVYLEANVIEMRGH